MGHSVPLSLNLVAISYQTLYYTSIMYFVNAFKILYSLSAAITFEFVQVHCASCEVCIAPAVWIIWKTPTVAIQLGLQGARGAGGWWIDTVRARPHRHTVCIRYLKDIPGTVVARYETRPKENGASFRSRIFFSF